MKLRDRKKRVLGNIKQEDQKAGFTLDNAPSSAVNDSTTKSVSIKQEDTKNDNKLLKQHGELDNRNYYYRCDICRKRMASLKSVLEHRNSIHNVRKFNNKKIKHIHMEPDINDPHYYCKSCERGYNDVYVFKQHLRHTHYMILKPIFKWRSSLDGNVPDPDDPNQYCKACNRTYSCKEYYKSHCRFTHGIGSANLSNRNSASDVCMDTYCQACDKRLANKVTYQGHLFAVHHVDWRLERQQKMRDVLPDVNDPNFYCRSCKKTLANKKKIRQHLMQIHCIFQSVPRKKSNLKPDVNDSSHYCLVCQKTFLSLGLYRMHLRQVHHMALPPLRVSANRENLPDPSNPHHYCSACQKFYKTRGGYRKHCSRTHLMVLNHNSIINPAATIDINDPKFHCAQCEHTYYSKFSFRMHLRKVHQI